jgi:low affinity Fe/Cu permease
MHRGHRSTKSSPAKSSSAPIHAAWFTRFARWTSVHAGRPSAFLVAVLVIVLWSVTGPLFGFSDTWQLVINTGTTIVTFLMVFLIQHTQNRDSQAIHVKLDELIRAKKGARNALLDLEDLSDEELEEIRASFTKLGAKAKRGSAEELNEAATEVLSVTRKK